jgi:hypothetical protein
MKPRTSIGALLFTLTVASQGFGGESPCCQPVEQSILSQCRPVGGWHPYGGGLLGWWDPCCYPRCGAPNDYCRKPLPNVCWPPYPAYFIWGPPEICYPQSTNCADHKAFH